MPAKPTNSLGFKATSPADLLAIGLGPGEDHAELEAEIDLEGFLSACPDLELFGCLGRGGMGLVYRARQTRLDRIVAVKLMAPELARDPEFAQRFEREARALARLDHPGIVRVHDFGEAGGVYYLVMEYVDGTNLRELIAQRPDADQAAEIIGQLCDALAYAHGEGVIHRDIKPENVLVDRKGRVRVADFGLAKLQRDGQPVLATRTRRVIGTPQYMAPEQIGEPHDVDHRADIFAIGVVFYEMLTGHLPVGRFPAPSEVGRGDARLDEIVLRSLESNRDLRFQAASDLRQALTTREVDDPHMATVPHGVTSLRPRRRRSKPARIVALGAAMGTAVGVALLATSARESGPSPEILEVAQAPEVVPAPPEPPPTVPTKLGNRWPSRELGMLDPATAVVVGIDWAELRQAPAVAELEAAYGDGSERATECKRTILDATNKVVIGLDASGDVTEALLHGTWTPLEVEPCLLVGYSAASKDDKVTITREQRGTQHLFTMEGGRKPTKFVISKQGTTILWTLGAEPPERDVAARLAEADHSSPLRDRVATTVDLSAPIWFFSDPAPPEMPLEIRSFVGQIELWDEAGVDVTLELPDAQKATEATHMFNGWIGLVAETPRKGPAPTVRAVQSGKLVRVRGAFPLPEDDHDGRRGPLKVEKSEGFNFNISFGSSKPDVEKP